MKMHSATDYAIAQAFIKGTLRLVDRPSRFGGAFVSIEDDVGVIETAADRDQANDRISGITAPAKWSGQTARQRVGGTMGS